MTSSENAFSLSEAVSINQQRLVKVLLPLALWASNLLPALCQPGLPTVPSPTNAAAGPTIRLDFGSGQVSREPNRLVHVFRAARFRPSRLSPSPAPATPSLRACSRPNVKESPIRLPRPVSSSSSGEGSQQSILDLEPTIRRQESAAQERAGSSGLLLSRINVVGPGRGTVEVEGTISNNVETVSEVRLRFNAHGKTSPICH